MGFEQLAALRQQLTEQAEQERRARQKSSPDSDKQAAPEARTGKPAAPQGRNGKPGRPAPNAGKPGQAAARSGKPATPHAQGARASTPAQDVDPVVVTISRLQRKFPKAFPKKPAAKVPLKLGVHEELLGQAEALGLPAEDITLAIKTWCQGARYWACLIENAARVSLDGEPVGVVTAVEAKRARQLAHRQRTGGAAKRKKPAAKPEQGAASAATEQDGADVAAQPIDVSAAAQAGATKADAKQTDSTQAVVADNAGEAVDTTSAHESDTAAGSMPESETASASAPEAETASASESASDSAPASESETSSVSGSETASVSKSETSSASKTASASASAPASVPAPAAVDEPDALAVMAANTPTDDTGSQSVTSSATDDSESKKS